MPANEKTLDGLVPAGFFIVRTANVVPGADAPRTRLVSLSSCLADFLPHSWTRRTTSMEDSERVSKAERFGCTPDALVQLLDAADRLDEGGQCAWQAAFASLETLHAFLAACPCDAPDALIIAMCASSTCLDSVLTKLQPAAFPGQRTLADTLRERHPLPAGGRLLGWEVLGEDGPGDFCSWQCLGLERKLTASMGLHLNANGLLERAEEATAVARHGNDADSGWEPIDYLPWALVEYSRTP
ncbi:MAG TPA: hypothetical protein VK824_02645 [Planctomycetota bacterium]|nr:hypothetical protein [Planctomycetota bacterium]